MSASAPIIGQVLGHYRVLEQIGAGGMGLVFRAADEQLERDVALKVLPPGMFADEAARKRFRREALVLAKLNHPNIGTVYEFGSQDGMDFLVMELVAGVPVDSKVAAGPLPQKQVLRLGIQLADGLASAHAQGVIHRDLKPANLRLTDDGRLKILDFGLAQFGRQQSDFGVTASVSEFKEVTGTLPYMSPEQLRGEVVTDSRSDIWSAGAVLYELATGRRAFPFAQASLLIDAILNKYPEAPSAWKPDISPGLQMVIVKCLDKDPDRRYQSARELRVDLERLTMPISQPGFAQAPAATTVPSSSQAAPAASRGLLKARVWATGVAVLLLAGLIVYVLVLRGKRLAEPVTQSVHKRRSVAVMGFKNLTGRSETAWLSTAIPEMLTTELAAGEKLRTISGEEIARMKMDLSLPDSDTLGAQTLTQVGKNLGADLLVSGSYIALSGGKIRLDVRLQDTVSGETLISVPETGDENNLFELLSRAGAQLREKCGAGQIAVQDEAGVRASLPSTPEATRLYAEGLAKLRVSDALAARDLLQRAVIEDPNHALAHSALAGAWSLLGYDEKARQSAKNAYDLSAPLSREDRLLVEARYRENSKEWDNAADSYRTLYGFFPDNVEYGLLLAKTQTLGGKGKEALTTVQALRRLPAPASEDPRIDIAASEAWQSLGDFKQGQALSAQAAERGKAQNAKLILARALYEEGAAFESLNDAKNAMAAADEASRIYQSVGDRYGLASTLEVTGQALFDQGDYAGSIAKYREELAMVREVGNRRAESSALNNLALVLDQQGNIEEAKKLWEQANVISRDVGDKNSLAMNLINAGGALKDQGDLAGADRFYEQALSVSREINNQSEIATSLTAVGTVRDAQGDSAGARKLLDQAVAMEISSGQGSPSSDKLIDIGDTAQHLGDLAGARKNYNDALALARAAGDKSWIAYALMGLGSIDTKSAYLAQAHKDYDEALSLRNELGEKDNVSATRVAISELAIEEGHAADTEASVKEGRDGFRRAHRNDDEIASTAVLVRALLAEGKTEGAQRELEAVAPIAAKNQNLAVQFEFALAKGRVEGASRKVAAAKTTLEKGLAKSMKAGYFGYQLEFRLVLEEVEAASGQSAAAHARLTQLEKDAKERGFDLIARAAAAKL
jgi:tetratricopeptide (TPR) repeat protein/tRNA A-37 threonylcarbamoyl transferase component Bud32